MTTTNLQELELVCKKADGTVLYRGKIEQDIAPHTEGKIVVALDMDAEASVLVEFRNGEYQVDAFCLKNAEKAASVQEEERLCAGCTTTSASDSSAALSVTDGSFRLQSAALEPLLSGIRLYTENLPKLTEPDLPEKRNWRMDRKFEIETAVRQRAAVPDQRKL